MRLLLVTANYRPSVGGIERFVETLARSLVERDHEVTVLCCRDGHAPLFERDRGVRVERVPASQLAKRRLGVPYPLPSPIHLVRDLKRLVGDAELVHVNDALYATSASALAAARALHRPSVLTQHVGFIPQSSRMLDAVEQAAIFTLGRSARLASRVVSYNEEVADWAENTWHLPTVQLLPIGVPVPDVPHDSREAIRASFDLPSDRFLALFVGRDVPKKRLDLVLAASDPAYEVIAVTDRPQTYSTPPGVRLVPFMAPDALERLLFAVDAFLLPSHAEGFPLILQEALLAGLPCVVTRVPGFERYLRDDEVIWIEPEAASIRRALRLLADDEGRRAELGSRGRAAGEREFGLERFVDAYESLYRELIAGGIG